MKRLVDVAVRWLQRWPKWTATALTVGVILWLTLSSRPVGDVDVPVFPGIDKAVHGIMFGWLAMMLIMDWGKQRGQRAGLPGAFVCAVLSAAFGVGIEFLQASMSLGRSYEVADMYADAAGAGAVYAVFVLRRLLAGKNT